MHPNEACVSNATRRNAFARALAAAGPIDAADVMAFVAGAPSSTGLDVAGSAHSKAERQEHSSIENSNTVGRLTGRRPRTGEGEKKHP